MPTIAAQLEPMHGDPRPGGFGERGSEGKIASVRFARERGVPFFGICLGMQMACIEGARNTAGIAERLARPSSAPTAEPVVGIITEWMSNEGLQKREAEGDLGGTMRLGAYEAMLAGNSHVSCTLSAARPRSPSATATATRSTRPIREPLEKGGLVFSGHVARRAAARDRRAARTIRGSSGCSSIPSSRASRSIRTRCSPASSPRRCTQVAAG